MPGKVKYNNLSQRCRTRYLGDFYTAISLLESRGDIKNFFKDLLTLSELVIICRRLQIAQLLLEGRTHDRIRSELGVGYTTISQVDRWLNNGFGGYKKVLKEMGRIQKESEKAGGRKVAAAGLSSKKIGKPEPGTFESFRKNRPAHFALINLLLDK